MARRKTDAAKETDSGTMTVCSKPGLNVRAEPSRFAPVLRVLSDGEKIAIDNAAESPKGWKALRDGGFVMAAYLN